MLNNFIMKKPEKKSNPKTEGRPSIVTPAVPLKVEQPITLKIDKPKTVQFPELSEIEVRVWKFIKKESDLFPVTIWTIANWCKIAETQAEIICQKLILDPKYRIQKVPHHSEEYAFEAQ